MCIRDSCKNRTKYLARRHTNEQDDLDAMVGHVPLTAAKGATVGDIARPDELVEGMQLEDIVRRSIARIDPDFREVLVLRDVEGLSAPEVARVLGMSVEAVKSRLHRARVAVREELAPALGRPEIAPPRGAQCPDVLALFSQHLEGEIDPSVCATMEAHLARCHHCHAACESLKRTLAICRQLPTPDVPASLAASVKTAIHAFLDQR